MSARYSSKSGYTIARRTTRSRSSVRTVQRRVRFGPTTAKYIGLAVLAILAIALLTQSSSNATTVYKQNALRQEDSQVQQDIQGDELEKARAQALSQIENTPVSKQLQPATKTETVDVGDVEKGTVAGVSTQKP